MNTDQIILFSLLVFVVACAVCNAIAHWISGRNEQYHDDTERAEAFVFSGDAFEYVLAGSGLTGHLTLNLPGNLFSLHFPYYGSCTALEVLALSGKTPPKILVETNYVFKGINQPVVDSIFSGYRFTFKKLLPFFRRRNQPLTLIRKLARRAGFTLGTNRPGLAVQNKYKQISMLSELYERLPDVQRFEQDVARLKSNIDLLRSRGAEVILFEIPIDRELVNAKLFQFQRYELKRHFAAEQYKWIPQDESYLYQTTDGLHLTDDSAAAFAGYLTAQLAHLKVEKLYSERYI